MSRVACAYFRESDSLGNSALYDVYFSSCIKLDFPSSIALCLLGEKHSLQSIVFLRRFIRQSWLEVVVS